MVLKIFLNAIAEVLDEHTPKNADSKKVRQEIVHFIDKTKKEKGKKREKVNI